MLAGACEIQLIRRNPIPVALLRFIIDSPLSIRKHPSIVTTNLILCAWFPIPVAVMIIVRLAFILRHIDQEGYAIHNLTSGNIRKDEDERHKQLKPPKTANENEGLIKSECLSVVLLAILR